MSSSILSLTRRSRPSQCGFWHWNDKERAREHLGMITKYGTQAFMEAMRSSGGNISMNKQFGVDFYSELVVVSLCTKDARIVHGGVNRGMKMIWCYEEDQSEFLEERRQWDLAEKHTQSIGFSIDFKVERSNEKEVPGRRGGKGTRGRHGGR